MKCVCRCIAILLCGVLCLSLCACEVIDNLHRALTAWETPTERPIVFATVGEPEYTYSEGYEAIACRYAYRALEQKNQELYDLILSAADSISPDADENGYPMPGVSSGSPYSETDIALTLAAFCADNPYVFWLSGTFSYTVEENTTVHFYSAFSPDEVVSMKTELDGVISAFYASVPDGLSMYEREKLAHNYLIERCDYDSADRDSTALTPENLKSHSVFGALVEQLCVCEGYGMALQLLLNGLGVECVTLTGEAYNSTAKESEAERVLHLWNAVRLDDGCWYHVDPTWDDQEQEMQRYNYFNLSDDMLSADHTLSGTPEQLGESFIKENGTEDLNFFIPPCNATTYHYYVYELPHLTGYDAAMLDDSLYEAALTGEGLYAFYVEPTLDYDAAIIALFREEQTFFDLLGRVSDRLEGYEIDSTNVTYYMNEPRRYVAAELKYY